MHSSLRANHFEEGLARAPRSGSPPAAGLRAAREICRAFLGGIQSTSLFQEIVE
jgi:hypothetical protein